MRTHDLVIIGAGSGNSIIGPEHDDLDIAMVERGLFGGTCMNVGCIPSKMLVYAAEIAELAAQFGRQCTVLAVDAARTDAGTWEVVTRSGTCRTGRDAVAWMGEAVSLGAGEILLTSWDRDGTRSGYDLELLRAAAAELRVPIIASGGASHADHMWAALQAGASAVLAASIFHDRETTVRDIKADLAAAGAEVRSC